MRATPHCTSSNTSIRSCSSHAARRPDEEFVASPGGCRPRPGSARRRKPAVFSSIAASAASRSLNSTTLKPGQQRREAVDHLRLVGRADRRHRPPVEGVREGDQVVLVRIALGVMIAPRGLDRALDRLDARIGEEDRVGEGEVDQPLANASPCGRAVEVGDVHQRRRLLLDRLGQVRVAVAEEVDRDARREVEISLALLAVEIDSLAAHRPNRRTRIDGHERRDGHGEAAPLQRR